MLVLGIIGVIFTIVGLMFYVNVVSGFIEEDSTGPAMVITILGAVSLYLSIVSF